MAIAVAMAVAVGANACTRESPASGSPFGWPLSVAELGWIREYSEWTIDVYDDDFGAPPGRKLVGACRDRLREVGPPPTSRLMPAWERAAAACPLLFRRGSVRRAKDIVEDADDLLVPLLMDSKELRLSGSPTSRSRADLHLSAIASMAADDSQEVRCWSDADWRRLVHEDNAWNAESEDPTELLGWQDSDTARIHMRLGQCNILYRFEREDVSSWKRADQVEAADSLDTLVHEIQHVLLPDADEDEVECAAVEELERFAVRLGATDEEAALLRGLYVTEVRPDMSDEYLSSCDGEFD
jgi:hypothetical protein